jgi:hypothetical protein
MENDFEVNAFDLDGEWLRQAMLYNKWAALAASALKYKSQIDLRRKVMKARLYKEAKERFEAVGKKPTGSDLEAEIRTNIEYTELTHQLIDAEEQVNLMDAGKWAMVEKSKALDRLCSDRDRGFFMPSGCVGKSDPTRSDRHQEKLKEVDKGLREDLNRKKISRG